MIQAVHTKVKGRARYRVDGLQRSISLKAYLESSLPRKRSIRHASASHLTGTVLIIYDPGSDPAQVSRALKRVIDEFLRDGSPIPATPPPAAGASLRAGIAGKWIAGLRKLPRLSFKRDPGRHAEPRGPVVIPASVRAVLHKGARKRHPGADEASGKRETVPASARAVLGKGPWKRHPGTDGASGNREVVPAPANTVTGRNPRPGDPDAPEALSRQAIALTLARAEAPSCRTDEGNRNQRRALLSPPSRAARVVTGKDQPAEDWHLMTAEATLTALRSSLEAGLSPDVAAERLRTFGPNSIPETSRRSKLGMFLDQFRSLPVALLGVAAGLALFTGAPGDALVILAVVTINAAIGFKTESESERTIQSLKHLVRPTAQIRRGGALREIPAEEVVLGDVLVLKPGTYVTADCRLIECHLLSIDESALTGESLPVGKSCVRLETLNLPLADRLNMAYMGTLVTGGQGLALVVATGRFTEIGKLQLLVGEASQPETPMERELRRIGNQLVFVSLGVCGLVFVLGLLRGAGMLQMLKTAVSLAVAAVPEGLPTVATTTMAIGIRSMRKHQVLIRNLEAVPTLGSVQTICLDKTGTITLNRMSVVKVLAGERSVRVVGAELVTESGAISAGSCPDLVKLLETGVLCNETEVEVRENAVLLNGSSTENSLLQAAMTGGIDILELRRSYPLLRTVHRAENRNFMCTYHEPARTPLAATAAAAGTGVRDRSTATAGEMPAPTVTRPGRLAASPAARPLPSDSPDSRQLLVAVKGSPLEVLEMCAERLLDGRRVPLTEDDRLELEAENDRMAGEALRVLGLARAEFEGEEDPAAQGQLVWLGLIGMADPIRDGVKELIGEFHQAGLETIMITGDQSPTAYAVGRELNLSRDESLKILDSSHLADVDPKAMEALAKRVNVFSRVSPAHKLQIVQALQRAGQVVAMTGDGINDGPALKAADIGIAMGHSGTDIAREVADVVLGNDELETMLIAIRDGRTILDNIQKTLHFLLSTNFSEILTMVVGTAAGVGHPLNTMQLLWINLLSDIFPGLALALEEPEPRVMRRPPRDPREPILHPSRFKRLGLESLVLSLGSVGAYGYGFLRYGAGPRAGTLAFQSLTLAQLLHALACRTETSRLLPGAQHLQPNPHLRLAVGGSLGLQFLTLVVPGLRSLLGTTPIGAADALVIAASSIVPLLVNELSKPVHKEAAA